MTARRIMKMGLAAGLALAGPALVAAQVAISLTLSPVKALIYEDVIAAVVIRNNSGQMLAVDSSAGPARFWLDVEQNDGRIVRRRDGGALMHAVEIMPGESRIFEFNVSRLFAMRKQGWYKIRAGLEIDGKHHVAPDAALELAAGVEIQRLTAGVPGDAQAVRTYILSYFQRGNTEYIYLGIEDSDKTTYGLFNLGRLVRVRPAEMMVDEAGNVHVLFQTMGMLFVHTALTPYGVQLFAKTYPGRRGRASLVRQPNGQITVPDGGEPVVRAAPTAEDKSAPDKSSNQSGSGGLLGQFRRPPVQKP